MFFHTSSYAHLNEELIMMTSMLVCSASAFMHYDSDRV